MGHDFSENYHVFEVTFETTIQVRVEGYRDEEDAQAAAEKALNLSWIKGRMNSVCVEADVAYGTGDDVQIEPNATVVHDGSTYLNCIDAYEEDYEPDLAEELAYDDDEEAA